MRIRLPLHYYQQFDADFEHDVPAEGYGGWRSAGMMLPVDHTAVVMMHAWDFGDQSEYPGWHRAVEYAGRARRICEEVFPPLLAGVRKIGMPIFHVVRKGHFYRDHRGYRYAQQVAASDEPAVSCIAPDPETKALWELRRRGGFPGVHNEEDIRRGFEQTTFARHAEPEGDEGIADTGAQLLAMCRDKGVNHLIYAGFAINGCILSSPGGMMDMSRYGMMCSVFRQAVTAIENRETARNEEAKALALWWVALQYGYIVDVDEFLSAVGEGSHDA